MCSWCFAEVESLHTNDMQVLAVSDPASWVQPDKVHLVGIDDLRLPPLLRQLHVLCSHIRPCFHFASLGVTTLCTGKDRLCSL